jgi:hypothetical protein
VEFLVPTRRPVRPGDLDPEVHVLGMMARGNGQMRLQADDLDRDLAKYRGS